MDCKFFTQPISAIGSSPPFRSQNENFSSEYWSVDERIHQFLKSFETTSHLEQLVQILNNRESKFYTPFAYTEQIVNLSSATKHLGSRVLEESLRSYEMEQAFGRIGEVVKDMAYFSPRRDGHDDDLGSLEELICLVNNVIKINNTLATKFEMLDHSHKKLETKRLNGLLYKSNYFWEYKKWQIYKKLDAIKKTSE